MSRMILDDDEGIENSPPPPAMVPVVVNITTPPATTAKVPPAPPASAKVALKVPMKTPMAIPPGVKVPMKLPMKQPMQGMGLPPAAPPAPPVKKEEVSYVNVKKEESSEDSSSESDDSSSSDTTDSSSDAVLSREDSPPKKKANIPRKRAPPRGKPRAPLKRSRSPEEGPFVVPEPSSGEEEEKLSFLEIAMRQNAVKKLNELEPEVIKGPERPALRPNRNPFPRDLLKFKEKTTTKLKQDQAKQQMGLDQKNISLGTSKANYIDPRIVHAWCKREQVPPNKCFAATLMKKFPWASGVDPTYRF